MGEALFCFPADIVTPSATLSLTSGAANAAFPLVNLQDGNPAKPFKATGTACTIRATFVSPVTLRAVSLGPHNLAGATVLISNNGTMGSTAFPIPANRLSGLSKDPWLAFPADAATQWNLAISGASANVAIGELQWIAQMRTLEVVLKARLTPVHRSIAHPTDFGAKLKYWLGVAQRRIQMSLFYDADVAASLLDLVDAAQGQFKSFRLVMDQNVNEAFLVDLTNDEQVFELLTKNAGVGTVDLEFLEIQRGQAL